MGGDAFTEKAFINALLFDGLESSTFKPLSKTKQWVDVPRDVFIRIPFVGINDTGDNYIHHRRGLCMLLVQIVRKAVLEP
jgi:hypothetical protein